MPTLPTEYLKLSDAVSRLEDGMYGGLRRPRMVNDAKSTFRRLSIGFGPWRERAARAVRNAALDGDLQIFVCSETSDDPKVFVVPRVVVARLISPRGGLPDQVIRPGLKLVAGAKEAEQLLAALTTGALVVPEQDFAAWYEHQRGRQLWLSQKTSKGPRLGRPRKKTNELRPKIEAIVNGEEWTAKKTVLELQRILARKHPKILPSHDTMARCVDEIFEETGDSRYRRSRRRRT